MRTEKMNLQTVVFDFNIEANNQNKHSLLSWKSKLFLSLKEFARLQFSQFLQLFSVPQPFMQVQQSKLQKSHKLVRSGHVSLEHHSSQIALTPSSKSQTNYPSQRRSSIAAVLAKPFLWFLFGTTRTHSLREAGVKATSILSHFWINPRMRWGLILLLVITPASKFLYLLFPAEGFGEYFIRTSWLVIPNFMETPFVKMVDGGWYFSTIHFWIFSCAEIWSPMVAIAGIFLIFPRNYTAAYFTILPFGYYGALLINRMFATSQIDYLSGVGISSMALMCVAGLIIFLMGDRLLFAENHVKRAVEARIFGLLNAPGITWSDKEELLKKQLLEWRSMNETNELFDKLHHEKEEEIKKAS